QNLTTVPRQLDNHPDYGYCLAFNPQGTTLAAISIYPKAKDRPSRYWDVQSGQSIPAPDAAEGWASCALKSPDGKLSAVIGDSEKILLQDSAAGKTLITIRTGAGTTYDLAFSPDGRLLASAQEDNTIRLWDVSTGRLVATLEGHVGAVHSIAFRSDG